MPSMCSATSFGVGILELLSAGESSSEDIVAVIQRESGITQAAVSQHLKVLRDSGFASVRVAGARRIYAIDPAPFQEVDAWLRHFRHFWEHWLEAPATEIARGKRASTRKRHDPGSEHA